MNDERNDEKEPRFLPVHELCRRIGIAESSFRIKLSIARKRGLPIPTSRRIGKKKIFDVIEVSKWLWEYGEGLKQPISLPKPKNE